MTNKFLPPPSTSKVFFNLLDKVEFDLFCDIGSRDAYEAAKAHRILPNAKYVCFECNRTNYEQILDDPEIDKSVFKVENIAISDKPGEIDFYEYHESGLSSTTDGTGSTLRRIGLDPMKKYKVRANRLDDYINGYYSELKHVVLWIDVEGGAHSVLNSGSKIFDKVCMIHVEVENSKVYYDQIGHEEIKDFLERKGFSEIAHSPHARKMKKSLAGDSLFLKNELLSDEKFASSLRRMLLESQLQSMKIRIYDFCKQNLPFLVWAWKKTTTR